MRATNIPLLFLDFEASGIAPDSHPIEIAAVSAVDHYHVLIRPVYYWTHWSWDAQDVYGISRESLVAEGREPAFIAADLNAKLVSSTLCSDSLRYGFWRDTIYEFRANL